jgi:hypothetical protein
MGNASLTHPTVASKIQAMGFEKAKAHGPDSKKSFCFFFFQKKKCLLSYLRTEAA